MRDVSAGRRDALVFTALSAPIALLLGGRGMLWIIPALAFSALLYFVVDRKLTADLPLAARVPRAVLVLEVIFLVAAMGKAGALASLCWSTQGTFPLFSIALLGLAAAGSSFGTEAASRGAVVLTWACGVFFAVLLAPTALQSSVPQSVGLVEDGVAAIGILLAAMCGLFLPARGTRRTVRLWGTITLLTLLILFVSQEANGAVPLLTAVKGAELFGTFQRYEAFASCAMTIGLYQLLVLFGCAAGEMLERLGKFPIAPLFLPAAGLIFVIGYVPGWFWLGGAAIFWGVVPLLATRSWVAKNGAKSEK